MQVVSEFFLPLSVWHFFLLNEGQKQFWSTQKQYLPFSTVIKCIRFLAIKSYDSLKQIELSNKNNTVNFLEKNGM